MYRKIKHRSWGEHMRSNIKDLYVIIRCSVTKYKAEDVMFCTPYHFSEEFGERDGKPFLRQLSRYNLITELKALIFRISFDRDHLIDERKIQGPKGTVKIVWWLKDINENV